MLTEDEKAAGSAGGGDTASGAPELLIPEAREVARQRRRRQFTAAALAAVVVAALLTALEVTGALSPSGRPPSTGQTEPRTVPIAAPPKHPRLEVYGYASDVIHAPIRIYAQRVGTSTAPRFLGTGLWVTLTPAVTGAPYLAFQSAFDVSISALYRLGAVAQSTPVAGQSPWSLSDATALLSSGTDIFVEVSDPTLRVLEVDVNGNAVRSSYSIPSLPIRFPQYCKGLECIISESAGTLASLVVDQGDLFGLQYNSYAAAIDNLTTGRQAEIPGYRILGGGAVLSDGDIAVVGLRRVVDSNESTVSTVHLLIINPLTMRVVDDFATAIQARSFNNVQLTATPGGGLLAFVATLTASSGGGPTADHLVQLRGAQLRQLTLPENSGRDMSVFGSTALIYGGPGKNAALSVDLQRWVVAGPSVTLRSPAGTYLFAVT